MKKSLLLTVVSFALMIVLCCSSFAAPTLMYEDGYLYADLDLNVSELFVVERGYAVPLAEDDLPAEEKMHSEVGQELWHVSLYLVEKDEIVFAPVLAPEGGEELIVGGALSEVYNKQYCKYTLYTSGIYVIEPVTANTDASVLDSDDAGAFYGVNGDKGIVIEALEEADTYSLENAILTKDIALDENSHVFLWLFNEEDEAYELIIYDKDTFAELPSDAIADYAANYVVKNNPDEGQPETLVSLIAYVSNLDSKTVIVSISTPGIDENGKYRNYYEVFNPYTGVKETELVGSIVANSAYELPSALESGLVVTVKNGVVDETAAPIGEIDAADSSKGLVWISGYDADNNTVTVVPSYVTEDACCKEGYMASLENYVYDPENADVNFDGKPFAATENGKIEYKLTQNTVVSVLEYSDLGNITKWGSMKLGSVDDLVNGKQYYKCYNDRFEDDNGNLIKKNAYNVMAYVYGNDSIADMIIVIVGELPENQNGMFNKKADCETVHDAYAIDSLTKLDGENGKFSYKLNVSNYSHSGNALLVICTYDADGVLVNSYFKTTTAEIGESDTFTTVEIADGERKVVSAKAFVFDELKLLSPLAKAIEK